MVVSTKYLGTLDTGDPRNPSVQIADRLRTAILDGRLRAGDKLPTQQFLASHYGVARETVKAALRALAEENLIDSRRGSGAYVRPDISDGSPERQLRELQAELHSLRAQLHQSGIDVRKVETRIETVLKQLVSHDRQSTGGELH